MTDKELRTLDEMLTNLEIWSTWNKTFANEMIGICSKMRNLLADRKTENSSEKPNSFVKDINVRSKDCETCKHYKLACELFSEICKYEPTTQTETQNSNLTFEKDECAKEYEELGLKELKELIEADRKTEPQTDGYMTAEQAEDYRKMLDKAEHKVYGNIEDEPQTDCDKCQHRYDGTTEFCRTCGASNFQPKDEPQTDCPWK